jgi:hypothetical protein
LCSTYPNLTHECVPNVLKLSFNVNECKPLPQGGGAGVPGRVQAQGAGCALQRVHQLPHLHVGVQGRGLHSSTFQLNLRPLNNASLTVELNLSTFGTHPLVNWVIWGTKQAHVKLKGARSAQVERKQEGV